MTEQPARTHSIRPPAVAGAFYPGDAKQLRRQLAQLLASADADGERPKALICPHAGYIYSGPTAASAYALLRRFAGDYTRVIVLGPTHRVPVRGLAAPSAEAFATPLGEVPVDQQAIEAIADLPQVSIDDDAHALEHSLEVQLPFLQTTLKDFSVLPLAVGQARAEEVAEVIERLWGGPETLILVSSDLSHYHPYAEARSIDQGSSKAILALSPRLDHQQACGATPVNGLLLAARRHGLLPRLLDLRNSGDTAGDRDRVVGYAAFAFDEPAALQPGGDDALGEALLTLARDAINARFDGESRAVAKLSELAEPGASFVTLTQEGELRGCIGSLEAHRPLRLDVQENAVAAAFRDPRFPPLRREELARTRVEVSLLTAPEPLVAASEAEALAELRPGEDGVIFQVGPRRATFLPQVWESLPNGPAFLARLREKAGLPADFWSPEVRLFRYCVKKWKEG